MFESEVEVKVLVYNQIQQKVYQTHSAVYSLNKKAFDIYVQQFTMYVYII